MEFVKCPHIIGDFNSVKANEKVFKNFSSSIDFRINIIVVM